MKLNKNSSGGEFTPHPETDGLVRGVIVDVTEPEKKQTNYGEKEQFRIVIESEMEKPDKERYCVWSPPFTATLNEKSNCRKFLKKAFGRDVAETDPDADGNIDLDALCIGHPVQMIIVHETNDGKTYANISHLMPDKTAGALKPSGNTSERRTGRRAMAMPPATARRAGMMKTRRGPVGRR